MLSLGSPTGQKSLKGSTKSVDLENRKDVRMRQRRKSSTDSFLTGGSEELPEDLASAVEGLSKSLTNYGLILTNDLADRLSSLEKGTNSLIHETLADGKTSMLESLQKGREMCLETDLLVADGENALPQRLHALGAALDAVKGAADTAHTLAVHRHKKILQNKPKLETIIGNEGAATLQSEADAKILEASDKSQPGSESFSDWYKEMFDTAEGKE